MAEPVEVILYTREGCSLCEKARGAIRAAESLYRLNLVLREVDIDADPALRARYTDHVPVIHVDGVEAFRHKVDPRELAEAVRGGVRTPPALASERCVPCHGGVPKLEGEPLASLAGELGNGWSVVRGHHLAKEFQFADFAEGLAFTNAVGAVAEEQGHHPDVHLTWGRVRIEIWTHAVEGLTRSDFVLAAKIDAVR